MNYLPNKTKVPQIAVLSFLFVLFSPLVASASVPISQPLTDTAVTMGSGGTNNSVSMNIGSGYTTTLDSVSVNVHVSSSINLGDMYLQVNKNGSYAGAINVPAITSGATSTLTLDITSMGISLTSGDTASFIFAPNVSLPLISFEAYTVSVSPFSLTCSVSCSPAQSPTIWVNTLPTPPDGVTITSPTATTYYSNPISFAGTYTNSSGFDQMTFDLRNITYNQQVVFSPLALAPMSVVNQPWSFTQSLYLNGNYELKAQLYNSSNGSTTPYTAVVSFGINSTSTQPLVAPTGTSTPVITCDPNSGYFQNSFCNLFVYLFSPSADVFDRFNTLKDDLKDHAPFGYFTSAYNSMYAISGSTTPTFALSEVTPIMTYVFTPLKNGIAWLLWLAMLVFIYKRLANIQV